MSAHNVKTALSNDTDYDLWMKELTTRVDQDSFSKILQRLLVMQLTALDEDQNLPMAETIQAPAANSQNQDCVHEESYKHHVEKV